MQRLRACWRASDFIDHARSLRRPLREAGYDTTIFHRLKETFATDFDEHYLRSWRVVRPSQQAGRAARLGSVRSDASRFTASI
ncbi:hypothetical protein D3C86_1712640 [compost metagenome]